MFMAMWAVRAVLLPLAIRGTMAAAPAHRQTMVAPAYRWGPGNSFPVAGKALLVADPHVFSIRWCYGSENSCWQSHPVALPSQL